ncbi:hypothetical protein TNCV_1325481 [Trichonephila clavipes]|nr:hypothetical protein TNCV_1325481 [Trichonephila clavipes]
MFYLRISPCEGTLIGVSRQRYINIPEENDVSDRKSRVYTDSTFLHPQTSSRFRLTVRETPGINFLRDPKAALPHLRSPHRNPQNDVPTISFSAIETDKHRLMLESFPYFSSVSPAFQVISQVKH